MKDRTKNKIKDKKSVSGFSFVGRAALILGVLLAGTPGVSAEGQPYLLRDINQAIEGSNPGGFIALGDRLFFGANDGTDGQELWVTDGTLEGTALVKDIYPGREGSWPGGFAVLGDRLFFGAYDDTHGEEIWVTDGTPEGTVLVKDISPGIGSSAPWNFTVLGDRLFFEARDGTHGEELWVTDGTPEGTVLVKDINPGPASAWFQGPSFISVGDRLFFEADDGTHGRELWVTDGTPGGTQLVADLLPGIQGSMSPSSGSPFILGYLPALIAHHNGTLFFDDARQGYQSGNKRFGPGRIHRLRRPALLLGQ